jgi:hypothetical protein
MTHIAICVTPVRQHAAEWPQDQRRHGVGGGEHPEPKRRPGQLPAQPADGNPDHPDADDIGYVADHIDAETTVAHGLLDRTKPGEM